MSQRRRRRIRVILDKARYRRHKLKKLLRKLIKVSIYAAILIGAILLVWLGLDTLFRPRPND